MKANINSQAGDLDAASAAFTEQHIGLKEADIPTLPTSSRLKRAKDDGGALLESF